MTYVALAAIFAALFTFNAKGSFSAFVAADTRWFKGIVLCFVACVAMAVLVERGAL